MIRNFLLRDEKVYVSVVLLRSSQETSLLGSRGLFTSLPFHVYYLLEPLIPEL